MQPPRLSWFEATKGGGRLRLAGPRRWAALALVAPVVPGPATATADTRDGKTELSALVGGSLLDVHSETEVSPSDVERRSIGGSFLVGLRAGRYLGDRVRIGVGFAVAPSHELTSKFPRPCEAPTCPTPPPLTTEQTTLVAYHYGAESAVDLTRGRARPFLGVGLGGVSYAGLGDVETHLAFTVEGGVKVDFGRFGFQLAVRDEIVPRHFLTHATEHDVQLQVGFLIRPR